MFSSCEDQETNNFKLKRQKMKQMLWSWQDRNTRTERTVVNVNSRCSASAKASRQNQLQRLENLGNPASWRRFFRSQSWNLPPNRQTRSCQRLTTSAQTNHSTWKQKKKENNEYASHVIRQKISHGLWTRRMKTYIQYDVKSVNRTIWLRLSKIHRYVKGFNVKGWSRRSLWSYSLGSRGNFKPQHLMVVELFHMSIFTNCLWQF